MYVSRYERVPGLLRSNVKYVFVPGQDLASDLFACNGGYRYSDGATGIGRYMVVK